MSALQVRPDTMRSGYSSMFSSSEIASCSSRNPIASSTLPTLARFSSADSFSQSNFGHFNLNLQKRYAPGPRKSCVRMQVGEFGRDNDNIGGSKIATGGNNLSIGSISDLAVPEMLRILEAKLDEAKSDENYSEAAKIRDLMRALGDKDPILKTKKLLDQAISEERYSDAAQFRDELKKLNALLEKGKEKKQKCYSDTVTEGVRVRVRSIFVKDRSLPQRQQYFFAYRIRISNESDRTVQLLNRHWVITDANGHVEEVTGAGVIGEQPVLRPGTSFEYTSACPLQTSYGTMEGEYEMVHLDGTFPVPFQVKVGVFALNMNDDELFN